MLDIIGGDPGTILVRIVIAIVIVAVAILVWVQLNLRVRQFGGGRLAGAAMAVGLGLLIVSLIPGLFPFEVGITILVAAFVVLYRPDVVVRVTGGETKEFQALHEGRELAVLVAERGGPRAASGDPEIQARLSGLIEARDADDGRRTWRLVRETLLADADEPGAAAASDRLAAADADLRRAIGVRPIWERSLEARARGEAPAE